MCYRIQMLYLILPVPLQDIKEVSFLHVADMQQIYVNMNFILTLK